MKKWFIILVVILFIAHGIVWYTVSNSVRDNVAATLERGVLLPNGHLAKLNSGSVSLAGYPFSTDLSLKDAVFRTYVGKNVINEVKLITSPTLNIPLKSKQITLTGLNHAHLIDASDGETLNVKAESSKIVVTLEKSPWDAYLTHEDKESDIQVVTENVDINIEAITFLSKKDAVVASIASATSSSDIVYFEGGERNGVRGKISITDINVPFYKTWLNGMASKNTPKLYNAIEEKLLPYFTAWDESLGAYDINIDYVFGTPALDKKPIFSKVQKLEINELNIGNDMFTVGVNGKMYLSSMFQGIPVGELNMFIKGYQAPIDYYLGAVSRIMEVQHEQKGSEGFDQPAVKNEMKKSVLDFFAKSGTISENSEDFSTTVKRAEQGGLVVNGFPVEEIENNYIEMKRSLGRILIKTSKPLKK